jgi:hypothetical protein
LRTTKIGNLVVPFERAQRERRPIPGLADYEITGTGKNIWSVRDGEWVDGGYSESSFPFVKLLADDLLVDMNRNAVTALAWLTPEQRAEVRERFPAGLDQPWPTDALDLEQQWSVSIYALQAVARTTEEALLADHEVRLTMNRGVPLYRVEGASVDAYNTVLKEPSRPPSQGGNTRALHLHVLNIDRQAYTFFALGTKKWVFKGDTVSFSYRLVEGQYRNIVRDSIQVRDANGAPVLRGDRGRKSQLRTAPARMPESRREQRDQSRGGC